MTGAEALANGTARLRAAGIDAPLVDSRRLLAHAIGVADGRLTLVLPEPMADTAETAFDAAITARCCHQPVAQIIGRRRFWGRDFVVTGDVLDPRPETETLIAAALDRPARRVLDLGTGSGCLLLTLLAEWPDATGLGVDASAAALSVARRNAAALGLVERAEFAVGDWLDGVTGRFDLIVANPPYIDADDMAALAPDVRDWEPRRALAGGADGLDAYRRILADIGAHLARPARVMVEIGADQGEAVRVIGGGVAPTATMVLTDMDGRDRVVAFEFV